MLWPRTCHQTLGGHTCLQQDAPFLACAAEPGAPRRTVVSRQGASLAVYDLATSRLISQVFAALTSA